MVFFLWRIHASVPTLIDAAFCPSNGHRHHGNIIYAQTHYKMEASVNINGKDKQQ